MNEMGALFSIIIACSDGELFCYVLFIVVIVVVRFAECGQVRLHIMEDTAEHFRHSWLYASSSK